MINNFVYFGNKVRQKGKALCTNSISAQVVGINYTAVYYSKRNKQGLL